MQRLEFILRFNTPAFLGNAEQSAQWRAPPIKALLRQWWRVAWAADHRFPVDVTAMRREEGLLFGVASDGEGDSRKSFVRIRLDKWDQPRIGQLPGIGEVCHPEVNRPGLQACPDNPQGRLISAGQYLGYGPFQKANAAIQAGDDGATLSLAVPTTHKDPDLRHLLEHNVPRIEHALWLMDRYGTLGGRSRNGWGSFALLPLPPGEGRGEGAALVGSAPLRPWRDCLSLDWPHAIGQDMDSRGNPRQLIWQTAPHDNWMALMKTLAVIKIGLRTQKPLFEFTLDTNAADKATKNGINHGRPQNRHWLSYPVTNHSVQPWDAEFVNGKKKPLNLRLPNQLRFKVRSNSEGKLVGVIFHVPHLPPDAFKPAPHRQTIEQAWSQVHRFLDGQAPTLTRIPE